MNHITILEVFNNELASNAETIKLISGKELAFRPITVAEQKKLSKLFLPTQTGKFADVYNISMALIQQTCINKDQLDFTELTEIDRTLIIANFLARNYTVPAVDAPCIECKAAMKLQLSYEDIAKNIFSDTDAHTPKTNTVTINNKTFTFTLFFPSIKHFSEFENIVDETKDMELLQAIEQNKIEGVQARIAQILAHQYFPLIFIKNIKVTEKQPDDTIVEKVAVDFTKLPLKDIIEICSNIPLSFFTSEDGIISTIQNTFVTSLMKNTSIDLTCEQCGKINEGVISFYAFFI